MFQIITGIGPMTILHPKYTDEIYKDKRLSFMAVLAKVKDKVNNRCPVKGINPQMSD